MKYFFDHAAEITHKLRNRALIAFFDFDLTLSPLADDPGKAFLPDPVRTLLDQLSRLVPVGIISGRDLTDLIARVQMPELNYAGNHGLEWHIKGQKHTIESTFETIGPRIADLKALAERFAGAIFEQKNFSANLHYRLVSDSDRTILETELANLTTDGLKVRWSKKTYEISPQVDWHKGSVCLAIMRALHAEDALPVYIGDDLTDEDAFGTLAHGITIRVGKEQASKAEYFINDQTEIDAVLRWLIEKIGQRAQKQTA